MKNRIAEYFPTSWFRRQGESSERLSENHSFQTWAQPVEDLVSKNPATALAVAFAAGVAIAWWLKRR
jgi:hypothetical protein